MSTHAVHLAAPRSPGRARGALAAVGAAVLGAAPHVLHHAGPLAGAALLGGVGGKLLFAALGFVLAGPMLGGLRRRTGSWRMPAGVLAAMAVMFTFSSLVLGPAITDSNDNSSSQPARPGVTQPLPSDHESHHR